MKQCITFPEERFLAVRPCLVAICGGNRAAGKLLGVLLYRYNLRIENRDDAKTHNDIKISQGQTPDQDISFSIYRKQWQLVDDLCDELSEKTIHNTAIPWLQLLGYLDIEEYIGGNRYDVNLEHVKQALSLFETGKKEQPQLEKFLIDNLQLEKFLIDMQLEKFPIDKKSFLLLLEKVLIANRNISHCPRGRKPKPDVASGSEMEEAQNLEEDSKKSNEEEEDITISASAENGMPALIHLEVEKKKRETDPHIPVIRVSSHSQGLSETSKEEEEEETTRAAKGHVHESTARARTDIPCIEHQLLARYSESSEQEASATSEHITLQQPPDTGQVASAPAAPTALGVSSPPPTSGVQQGAEYGHTPPQQRLKKTVIVKDTAGPPAFPSESDAWGTTTCLRLFDFWRGAPLCDLGQLKYASSCAKRLAETYNRKQVVIVRTAMNNQKFWKEQGGADVCDVARHMQKELNKLKMPTAPAQQPSPDQSRPTLEEVECIDPTWCVYQRPGDTQEWILWQGELLTEDEANDRGYGGGGGLYKQTQYA